MIIQFPLYIKLVHNFFLFCFTFYNLLQEGKKENHFVLDGIHIIILSKQKPAQTRLTESIYLTIFFFCMLPLVIPLY